MRAIRYDRFGGPEVLCLTETGAPQPGPGQLRLRIEAAAVNPIDYKIRNGWMQPYMPTPLPAVPGSEAAGVVDAVGPGVTAWSVGDEVFGWTETGAYAEYALASAVVRKPAGLDWAQAAALPVACETATRVLDLLGVGAGDTLLLHGAAGAVGSAGVQLALARGARVIGTASPANHAYLSSLGALPVAYGEGLVDRVREVTATVDAVFDVAGRGALEDSVELRGGTKERIVTIADMAAPGLGITFSRGGAHDAAAVEAVRRAVEAGVRVPVAGTRPLAEAAKALELSEAGHVRGKLVLLP
ncbi:NADP-dependent oxidoreductase [Streptomyces monticola]|uniref:NADP-dependent oxidoreductase n=1 Tax=Streptomyces monticola TaxID=2666263 RepID=A0ABW2JSJ4_9ACTN